MVTTSLPDEPERGNHCAKNKRGDDSGRSPLGQATAGKADRNKDEGKRSNKQKYSYSIDLPKKPNG